MEKLFGRKQFKALKDLLCTMEPVDIADVFSGKPPAERVFLFRLLPKDLAIDVFEFLEGTEREELLSSFTDSEVAAVIEEMSDDDRTALFDELPAKTVKNSSPIFRGGRGRSPTPSSTTPKIRRGIS